MKTLLRLAILKRWSSAKKGVTVRLGQYIINGPDYHVISTLLKEKFVDEEYYFSPDDVRPVIIDGGANIGISVLYFK
ncbi:MAG: FkbM family methyltransferase, partial [Chitinophagaceae bacterium]